MRERGSRPDPAELERAIDGDVFVPRSPGDERLPRPFNARFDDLVPTAVVSCTSADDVAETISFARRHGLRTATRSGGHDFAGRSSSSGVLIDLAPMNAVALSGGLARVGAGARLGEVYVALMSSGLTIAGGTCPSVGIGGLTLGGGLGIFGRTYGLTADRLLEARVVLPDGRIVECDEHHHDDLFWALRGAGAGGFGVVTELAFRPVPASAATSFRLAWSFAHAHAIVRAWLDWGPDAPDEMAASLALVAGAEPDQPISVEVFGTMLGSRAETTEHLERLTARIDPDPSSALIEHMSYSETMRFWAERAGERLEEPRAASAARAYRAIRSEFFAHPFPAEAIDRLLDVLAEERVHGQERDIDLSPWGGAYNRIPADATAFAHRDQRFWVKHAAAIAPSAPIADRAATHAWVDRSWRSLQPWGTGRVFPNFADPDLDEWGPSYFGPNYGRLLEIKRRYDPGDLLRSTQSVPLT